MILKMSNREVVFQHGKHKGETIETVAEEDPGYLKWVFNNASEDLPKEVHDALEDVMEEKGIEP